MSNQDKETEFNDKIIELINSSSKLLMNNECEYKKNRDAIHKLFTNNFIDENNFKEMNRLRLIAIDGFDSTNFNRTKNYGIDDLSKYFNTFKNYETLKNIYLDCFNKNDLNLDNINKLFYNKYGIHKNRLDNNRLVSDQANSLISKYGFYITDFKFPIYDLLSNKSLRLIELIFKNEISIKKLKDCKNEYTDLVKYYLRISLFKDKLGNQISFDHLDNFLWSIGKIRNNTYLNVILNKDDYIRVYNDMNSIKLIDYCLNSKTNILDKDIKKFICDLYNINLLN